MAGRIDRQAAAYRQRIGTDRVGEEGKCAPPRGFAPGTELVAAYPLDEAMSLAVGGNYEQVGEQELLLLRAAGLRDDTAIFDLGCGSGRLASALGRSGLKIQYLGTDVVGSLLDYARSRAPAHFRFALHRELSIPLPNNAVELVS